MKKSIMLSVILVSAICSFAQFQNRNNQIQYGNNNNYNYYSAMTINSNLPNEVYIVIDNSYTYTLSSLSRIGTGSTINNISTGNHSVNIYEIKNSLFGRPRQVSLYNSNIYFRQGFNTNIFIDVFGTVRVNEQQIAININYPTNNYPNNNYPSNSSCGNHKRHHNDRDDNRRNDFDNRNDNDGRR